MAIVTEVTGKYSNNNVQVKVSAGNTAPRYYKVPEAAADSFQSEYKSNSKRMVWTTTGFALLGVFAGMLPAYFISKRTDLSTFMRQVINIGTGLAGGLGGMALGNKIGINNHKDMLEKYGAEEMEPPKSGLPI